MADNEFGYTAWGMDWVRLAEPLRQTKPDPLLPRARSIARNDGVQASIDGRTVRATIHRGGQASVIHVEVAPMPRSSITAVAEVLTADATPLTDDMYRAVREAGVVPAPVLAGTDCSCSARSERCLHLLAVYYDMARRVDEDPRTALQIQDYFRALSEDKAVPTLEHQRWIPINALDPAAYFGT